MIGTTLNDRYEVRSLLGQGGMAAVYKAFDLRNKTHVALKTGHAELEFTERRAARIAKEYQILSKLSHPSIVKAFDFYEQESEWPFFTMQLVEGVQLDIGLKKLRLNSPLSEQRIVAELLRLLRELALALEHAHANGIIYCDLKPSNLLLTGNMEIAADAHIKLIDFGISRVEINQELEATGTSLYNSPEQIRNETLDPRSDIYSFGITAFELLTGAPPFESESYYSATQSHFFEQVPSAIVQNRTLTQALDKMLRICMKKERADRYQSMSEVVARLTAEMGAKKRPSLFSQLSAPVLGFLRGPHK